jgi:hypothetical protein
VGAYDLGATAGNRRRIGGAARVDGEGAARLHGGSNVETENNLLAGERGPAIDSTVAK